MLSLPGTGRNEHRRVARQRDIRRKLQLVYEPTDAREQARGRSEHFKDGSENASGRAILLQQQGEAAQSFLTADVANDFAPACPPAVRSRSAAVATVSPRWCGCAWPSAATACSTCSGVRPTFAAEVLDGGIVENAGSESRLVGSSRIFSSLESGRETRRGLRLLTPLCRDEQDGEHPLQRW